MPLSKLHFIVVEGPIGVGKTSLARRLAERLDAAQMLEQPELNPFLPRFYEDMPRHALATQLFFLFQRVELTRTLAQPGMFAPLIVSDFTLEKDRLFARLTLSDEEYRLYSLIHEQVAPKLPRPDLVIWLDGPMVVLRDRIRRRGRQMERRIEGEYLRAVADAYGALFDERSDLPLLVLTIALGVALMIGTDLTIQRVTSSRMQGAGGR